MDSHRRRFAKGFILTGFSAIACFMYACATLSDPPVEAHEGGATASSGGPPPLVVDKSAPLLLDDPGQDEASASNTAIDNSTCFVCHANYQDEPLAMQHASKGIGCFGCHGDSIAHKNDENNTTPPDRMFPSDKIDDACRTCHAEHDAPATKVIARWQERCPAKTDPTTILCTDCHGNHRLKIRTVRWDKTSGGLLQ